MKTILATTLLATALMSGIAHAEDDRSCTTAAKDKWMTEDAVKAKAKEAGLDVRRVKVEGSCYEVYAIDAKGAKIEAYYNPETGAQVGLDGEDD